MEEFKWEEIDFKSRRKGEHPAEIAYQNWQKAIKGNAHPKFIENLEQIYKREVRLTAFILSKSKRHNPIIH